MKKKRLLITIICIVVLIIVLWITTVIPRIMEKITADKYVKKINIEANYDGMEYAKPFDTWFVYYKSQEEKRYVISVDSHYFPTNVVYDGFHGTSMINDSTPSEPISNETESKIIPNDANIIVNNEVNNIETPTALDQTTENVKIDIVDGTLTRDGAEIIITDNNTDKYGYGTDFKLQKKENNNWVDLEYLPNTSFTDIAYKLNNNTLKLNVNFKEHYGTLKDGIYRLSKPVYSNRTKYDIYSNEFEIK